MEGKKKTIEEMGVLPSKTRFYFRKTIIKREKDIVTAEDLGLTRKSGLTGKISVLSGSRYTRVPLLTPLELFDIS